MRIFRVFTALTALAAFLCLSAFGAAAEPVALAEERVIPISAETSVSQSAECDGESFSVSIPKNCESEKLRCLRCGDGKYGLLLAMPNGVSLEIVRWDGFGMCGTGVSFESVDMDNGAVTVAVESSNNTVWLTMIKNIDGRSYVLMGQMDSASYSALKGVLLNIMDSISENR